MQKSCKELDLQLMTEGKMMVERKKKVDRPCKGHRALQKGKSLKKGKRKTAKGSSTGTLHPVNCLWKKWQGSGLELVGFGLQLVCSSLSILGS